MNDKFDGYSMLPSDWAQVRIARDASRLVPHNRIGYDPEFDEWLLELPQELFDLYRRQGNIWETYLNDSKEFNGYTWDEKTQQ